MEKIPCIECNPKLWDYIKPFLKEWGYKPEIISNFPEYSILVLNRAGKFGVCTNVPRFCADSHNRELVTNVEEFLQRAAKLKGYIYKRKNIMKINGIEIKPGMGICIHNTSCSNFYVVFPLKDSLGVISYGGPFDWDPLKNFLEYNSEKIVAIYDIGNEQSIRGPVLWEKSKEIEITMDEIAKKFNIPVEQLRIKK